mgnify:CR=1 FL=1
MRFLFLVLLTTGVIYGQQQPIEFPHNTHMDQGLACVDCHSTADTAAAAELPSVTKCMLCHEKIAVDAPGVAELREFAKRGHEIPWIRVYRFEELAAVKFRHAAHVQSGINCVECHGDVGEMTVAMPVIKHTMGTCVNCHRKNQASDDCVVCHY